MFLDNCYALGLSLKSPHLKKEGALRDLLLPALYQLLSGYFSKNIEKHTKTIMNLSYQVSWT